MTKTQNLRDVLVKAINTLDDVTDTLAELRTAIEAEIVNGETPREEGIADIWLIDSFTAAINDKALTAVYREAEQA